MSAWKADYMQESSTLGFKPGEWPEEFEWGFGTWHKTQVIRRDYDREIAVVLYRRSDGRTMAVLND